MKAVVETVEAVRRCVVCGDPLPRWWQWSFCPFCQNS